MKKADVSYEAVHLDVLKEIGNIGAGNAATSLAILLDQRVNISVPTVHILDYHEATEALGGPEEMVVGVLLLFQGDLSGMMMYLLQKDFAHMTLSTLLGESFKNFESIDEMGYSALQELANIMTASYLNAIGQLTGLTINVSVPSLTIDMAGAIMSVPAIHFEALGDRVLFIEDDFFTEKERATSQILLMPDQPSMVKMLASLGIDA